TQVALLGSRFLDLFKLLLSERFVGPRLNILHRTLLDCREFQVFGRRQTVKQVRRRGRTHSHVIGSDDGKTLMRETLTRLDATVFNGRADQPDSLWHCDVGVYQDATF